MASSIPVGKCRRLLLISNSTLFGSGYLEHCGNEIKEFLNANPTPVKKVLFFPYALKDHDGYAAKAKEAFSKLGFELNSIHNCEDPIKAIESADAFFIGGGNTFRLLKALYDNKFVEPLREKVLRRVTPYIGTSAGSNVATCSIRTTNDMPIVMPPTFEALNFVPFNINAHYLDADPNSKHMGETREKRLEEFLEENDNIVVGLREGCMLRVEDDVVELRGVTNARIFMRNKAPQEFAPVTRLDFVLQYRPAAGQQ